MNSASSSGPDGSASGLIALFASRIDESRCLTRNGGQCNSTRLSSFRHVEPAGRIMRQQPARNNEAVLRASNGGCAVAERNQWLNFCHAESNQTAQVLLPFLERGRGAVHLTRFAHFCVQPPNINCHNRKPKRQRCRRQSRALPALLLSSARISVGEKERDNRSANRPESGQYIPEILLWTEVPNGSDREARHKPGEQRSNPLLVSFKERHSSPLMWPPVRLQNAPRSY